MNEIQYQNALGRFYKRKSAFIAAGKFISKPDNPAWTQASKICKVYSEPLSIWINGYIAFEKEDFSLIGIIIKEYFADRLGESITQEFCELASFSIYDSFIAIDRLKKQIMKVDKDDRGFLLSLDNIR